MAAEDPLTPGEIIRAIKRLEDEDRAAAARITLLAAEMLPVKLWDAEHRALAELVRRHEQESSERQARLERMLDAYRTTCDKRVEDMEEAMDRLREQQDRRSELTWQKVIGLLGALAALALVIVTVLGQSKGIH